MEGGEGGDKELHYEEREWRNEKGIGREGEQRKKKMRKEEKE